MPIVITRRCLIVAMAGALAGACRAPAASLRMGLHAWPANDLYHLAGELGLYEGVAVRVVDYASADQGMQAFRNGAVELYPCTLDEAITLAHALPDARIVQVLDDSRGADAIVARPDVAGAADLRWRRIGYEATALGAYVLSRGLELTGIPSDQVTPVHLPVDEHERAFAGGRVDAVVTYEPVRRRLLAMGGHDVFDSTRIPGEIVDVLVTWAAQVDDREEALAAIVRGWLRAAELLRTDPDTAGRVLAPRLRLPAAEVPSAFTGIHLADLAENAAQLLGRPPALLQTAERLCATMLASGLLDARPDLGRLVDPRVVARIVGT